MNDVLWTPTHGHTRVGRPAKTYIYQLCADTGYRLEDLPRVKTDKDNGKSQGNPYCQHMMMTNGITVQFNGISTLVAYLMPNPLYTYIYIYIYIYQIYMICKDFADNIFK